MERTFVNDETPARGEASARQKAVLGLQYFLYFGVMGVYLPYFNLYGYHLGLSGFEVGVLSSLRSVAWVLFPLAWGALADRTGRRRAILLLCHGASTTAWAGFLFTERFAPMACLMVIYAMFYAPIISFLEAASLEVLGREKSAYGRVRLWGSISFIAMVLLFGLLIDASSERIVVVAIAWGSLAMWLAALGLPRESPRQASPPRDALRGLLRGETVVFLASAFLMLVSHGAYYGFFSIHLAAQGRSTVFIGAAWALASAAEIAAMTASPALFRRFSLERVLLVAFSAAVLRWGMLSVTVSTAALLVSQLLHALTYGAFHMASILYMDRLSPPGGKNLGQALNNAFTYGLGLMAGFLLQGALFTRVGSFGLFAVSAWIALVGGLLFGLFQARARRSREGTRRQEFTPPTPRAGDGRGRRRP